ncbi:tetratricopeptide repeat protein [Phytohabitans sp. ZYX-F-186]|uniref:non-specific serine/threonine protein kinase n=1 Tax=Phytohabitans maris TaxID=3071409 RepID=A0ABU0ZDU3_9ACTN|nr:tetratricopeptide repeat protein [Phytohabitans sp. ZYX-F-186]MDQ7905215.1 tetratricopeptide repeat protein [Phytohabitans sp. ZYX-F-186]
MIACRQSGCTGAYAADGYCDECGHKAGLDGAAAPASHTRVAARGGLGANLVVVPPVPLRDPLTAVMADPRVPEHDRFCGHCGEPVGRGHDGRPGRTEGFCAKDGTPFSFVPRLSPGEVVDARYEILGALAHGGVGWVYLARDRNVSDSAAERWVVLKGLIDTGDRGALASAITERRFLVEVDHPNIVKIHDFVQHPDPKTGQPVGYIVMEYVGGRSLRELAVASSGPDGGRIPLPLPQVLAYGLEVLPALGYLHARGLLFCDFKPDNVIQAEEQLKLIDLGAVRRVGDNDSVLYGTPGYEAPEIRAAGPSVASDLYTVGRTLARLSIDFPGFATRYAGRLPDREDVELFAREESYHRFLRRATHPDVRQRFQSAGEMADQLLGVLREVLAAADGKPRASGSTRFTPERTVFGNVDSELLGPRVAAALPVPLVDPADPAAGFLAALSASGIDALRSAPVQSLEVRLQIVRALVDAGDPEAAGAELWSLPDDGTDWRLNWYAGLIALAGGRPDQARAQFDAVYDTLPGEPAAQLALAAACELVGDAAGATRRYERVWRVDHAYVSAAFGFSRMRLSAGDRAGAVAVLDEVPETSSQQVPAQIAAVRGRLDHRPGTLTDVDLIEASSRLERLRLDTRRQATLAVEMFQTALRWLGRTGPGNAAVAPPGAMLGHGLTERELRFGLERNYRVLASLEEDQRLRCAMVDQANDVRPWTIV